MGWSTVLKNYSSWSCWRLWICKDHRRKKIFRQRSNDAEKENHSHTLHFFISCAIAFFDEIRQILRFLVECLSSWIAMGRRGGPVRHGEVSNYGDCDRKGTRIYQETWKTEMTSRYTWWCHQILAAHYEDIESLSNLGDCNCTMWKTCKELCFANVFKIFNYWSRRQEDFLNKMYVISH